MIDFQIPSETTELAERIRTFVVEKIVAFEKDPRLTAHGPTEDLRDEMVGLARNAGLLTLQAPRRFGGIEPTHLDQAVLFEAAGWSTLGPVALNCAAPDEGNMFLLSRIANDAQAEEFLRPVIEGRQRSVFAMTEPDGAGSDPGQLTTTAVRDGDDYVINGRKWLITGANGAKTWIIMADLDRVGATLFLCDGETPGIVIERTMDTMDRNYVEGHGVVVFDGLRLPASALLGEEAGSRRLSNATTPWPAT